MHTYMHTQSMHNSGSDASQATETYKPTEASNRPCGKGPAFLPCLLLFMHRTQGGKMASLTHCRKADTQPPPLISSHLMPPRFNSLHEYMVQLSQPRDSKCAHTWESICTSPPKGASPASFMSPISRWLCALNWRVVESSSGAAAPERMDASPF